MRPIITFIIGSSVFFKDYSDYKSHDIDKLCIMDTFPIKGTNVLNLKKNGEDVFFYRNMNKSEFIKDTLESNVSMRVGKWISSLSAHDKYSPVASSIKRFLVYGRPLFSCLK